MASPVGYLSYATVYEETAWGERPGSPTRIHLPVEACGLKRTNEVRRTNAFTGILPPKHQKHFRSSVGGAMSGPLLAYGAALAPLAKTITNWGMPSGNSPDLPTYGVEWAEGDAYELGKDFHGLRAESCTISGTDDSGRIDFALDLKGRDEDDKTSGFLAIPDDMEKLSDFDFDDTVVTVDTVAVKIGSFSIKQTNGLKYKFMNVPGGKPHLLVRTQRLIEVQIMPMNDDPAWDEVARNLGMPEHAVVISIRGNHNGTGTALTTEAIGTFTMPRLGYVSHDPQGGREDILMNGLNFYGLKPDSSSDIFTVAWTEA